MSGGGVGAEGTQVAADISFSILPTTITVQLFEGRLQQGRGADELLLLCGQVISVDVVGEADGTILGQIRSSTHTIAGDWELLMAGLN